MPDRIGVDSSLGEPPARFFSPFLLVLTDARVPSELLPRFASVVFLDTGGIRSEEAADRRLMIAPPTSRWQFHSSQLPRTKLPHPARLWDLLLFTIYLSFIGAAWYAQHQYSSTSLSVCSRQTSHLAVREVRQEGGTCSIHQISLTDAAASLRSLTRTPHCTEHSTTVCCVWLVGVVCFGSGITSSPSRFDCRLGCWVELCFALRLIGRLRVLIANDVGGWGGVGDVWQLSLSLFCFL